jgi:hypothetical protein
LNVNGVVGTVNVGAVMVSVTEIVLVMLGCEVNVTVPL